MKQALYGTAFIAATLGLLWFGLGPLPDETSDYNEVSRGEPSLLGLTPAVPQPALAQPVTAKPVNAMPEPAPEPVVVATPAPQPEPAPAPQPVAVAKSEPAPRPVPSGDAMEQMRAMSYGILQEMKAAKPRTAAAAATEPQQQEANLAPAPAAVEATPAPQKPAGQQYTVKPGDSLPGIAFRFYGTTVAYFQIIDANPDQLSEPSDLRAGMVLTIPGT